MILAGGAEIELKENAQVVRMGPGDWAYLPANCVHRVKSTEKNTTWLAVHVGRPASDDASGHNHQ
jgi:quercetin dioxygenase-like cupin family protein